MVNRANRFDGSLGGHIGTAMSSCTLYEVGFNNFFHARTKENTGDVILIQGHTVEQTYARSYLEGVFNIDHLNNFRRESKGRGIGQVHIHIHI